MEMTMQMIAKLFPAVDFSRGVEYYRQNRVRGMNIRMTSGRTRVECWVDGTYSYRVILQEMTGARWKIQCDCPRFEDAGSCKHIAAAMVAYAHRSDVPATERQTRALLEHYVRLGTRQDSQSQTPARLVPRLNEDGVESGRYPAFSLRVGREKLYVVRNVESFLSNVRDGKTVALGKQLTMDHSITEFDSRSQTLIRILMNEFRQFRSNEGIGYAMPYYYGGGKGDIIVAGDGFDRIFDLYAGETMETTQGSVRLTDGNPRITMTVEPDGDAVVLKLMAEEQLHYFGSVNSLYAMGAETLYRCDVAFRERVYPMLNMKADFLRLGEADIPTLCACVLPEIRELVTVEDPQRILESYLPEECTPCFYFDMEEDTLRLELKFRYGDQEYPERRGKKETVRRDPRAERRASAFARRHFPGQGGYERTGEEEIYDFLTGTLDSFREQGEVYVSDRLRRRQLPPARASVGVSVSDGVLTLNLDTGEFPAGELERLYQSLLKKRKYHRLTDGRFLPLEGGAYETLAEMSHMLQLPPRELEKGTVRMPAFRALYLDSVLSGSEELNVTRDRQFRSMIRSFKSLSESDFTVPESMAGILRPYQTLGFQWLKTLESCGFGGILADEMGLGKTLQVIAFLASLDGERAEQPSLVVCPASLILNWGEEFRKFAPEIPVVLIYGTAAEREKRMAQGAEARVWVTSYELLRQDIEKYRQREFYACVLDEGQHIKNQSTLVSRAVKAVNCRQRFVLTGTPIENRLSELWNLFDFLMPGYLFSHNAFVEKLEKPIIKSRDDEAMCRLRRLVQPFLLRRLKSEVLKELPPKIEHIRRIPMGQTERKTYLSAVSAAKNTLEDTGKLKILAALTQLRQICCDPRLCFENYTGETSKLEACLELCAGMTANGHQILLFSQFTSMLDILRQRLNKMGISSFTLQGSTSKEQRARLVKEFNAGGASVFLISLKAGGTGLNLTAADVVIHYDPWWNLAAQNQATDRAHRMGQRRCVQIYKLIAKDTIEERILDLQDKKAELLDIISGEGGSILEMSKEELLALLD